MQKDKDDLLFAHQHSGFDRNNYGCGANANVAEFPLSNDRAYFTLRVTVNP